MDEIAEKIQLYHSLSLGCLWLAFSCLMLAVGLFFHLDIWNVIGYLTGWQAKKKIRELEAVNEGSGNVDAEERSVIRDEAGTDDLTTPLEISSVSKGRFHVERELMLIHTDEVI